VSNKIKIFGYKTQQLRPSVHDKTDPVVISVPYKAFYNRTDSRTFLRTKIMRGSRKENARGCSDLYSLSRGARKLTGENLKPVWAEFSTKLGCYDDVHVIMYTDAHPYL